MLLQHAVLLELNLTIDLFFLGETPDRKMATFALGLQMGRYVIEQRVSLLYLLLTAKDLLNGHQFTREGIFVKDLVLALGECGDGEYQPAFIGVVLLFEADAGLLKLS